MVIARSSRRRGIAAFLVFALSLPAAAQDLVRDINRSPSTQPGHSDPRNFVALPNGDLLLAVTTPSYGQELWRTDGTVAGTRLVADLQPGPVGSVLQFESFLEFTPGVFLFAATTVDEGRELWRTDGTPAGTWLIADLLPGQGSSSPQALTRIGNRLYFIANDGVHGPELWSSDGTPAGTRMLVEIVPGPNGVQLGTLPLMDLGTGSFVFSIVLPGSTGWELWRSDGTAAGTAFVTTLSGLPFGGAWPLARLGSRAIFTGGQPNLELMVTDGTAAGTMSLRITGLGADIQVIGGLAYFAGIDSATGTELWKTDGTLAGTQLVRDLMPGGGASGNGSPSIVGELGGEVVFFATTPTGRALYRSNGTSSGTVLVAPLADLGSSSYWTSQPRFGPRKGVNIGNELWFPTQSSAQPNTFHLYRTDGTLSGTQLVTALPTWEFAPVGNGNVLLRGDDGSRIGSELYLTNGTPGGTRLLVDLTPAPISLGSDAVPIGSFQGQALVIAEEPGTGRELWLSDGTLAGTRIIADLEPGPGSLSFLSAAANERRILILGTSATSDEDPYFSDGTSAGTYQLDLFAPNSFFYGTTPAAFGERFVFAGSLPSTGAEPWITDGTQSGTYPLADLAVGRQGSNPEGWFVFGDRMLFRARNAQRELYLFVTDGTISGTLPLLRLDDDSGLPPLWEPTIFQGRVWFAAAAQNQGIELWSTDGTTAGTVLEHDILPGSASSRPGTLAVVGPRLLVKITGSSVPRLFEVSPLGAFEIPLGARQIDGPYALDANRAVFAVVPAGILAAHLWSYDATGTGATRLADLPSADINLRGRRLGAEYLIFSMTHPALGSELWSSSAVANTLQPITSFDARLSDPRNAVRAGDRLVFSADDGIHGRELFSIRFHATNDFVAEPFGSGCAGSAGLIPTLTIRGAPRWSTSAPFFIELARAAVNAPALVLWSQDRFPIDLPGCTLWVGAPLGSISALSDSSGAFALPIAVTPEVVGERFRLQCFVFDPGGAAFGAASATPAVELVIGR